MIGQRTADGQRRGEEGRKTVVGTLGATYKPGRKKGDRKAGGGDLGRQARGSVWSGARASLVGYWNWGNIVGIGGWPGES